MKILHSSNDIKLIQYLALMYSKFWNIVESKDYANLIIEDGTISCGMLGLKHTEETKIKISNASKASNNGFYGKKHSKETKEKISYIHKGKVISEETKHKMSVSTSNNHPKGMLNKKHSEESKLKISNYMKGKQMPEYECPNCNKIGRGSSFKRYHFNNCEVIKGKFHYEKIECPHCGKVGGGSNMIRYHFNNCNKKEKRWMKKQVQV